MTAPAKHTNCMRRYARDLLVLKDRDDCFFEEATILLALAIASRLETPLSKEEARVRTDSQEKNGVLLRAIVWVSCKFVQGHDHDLNEREFAETVLPVLNLCAVDAGYLHRMEIGILKSVDYDLMGVWKQRCDLETLSTEELREDDEGFFRYPCDEGSIANYLPNSDWNDAPNEEEEEKRRWHRKMYKRRYQGLLTGCSGV